MHHVAIMKRSWNFIPMILQGKKIIESRWYSSKNTPWGRIEKGDVVYFKNSGEAVTLKANVTEVITFSELTPEKVKKILGNYGKEIGIENEKIEEFFGIVKDKKYCILMKLKNPETIKPFEINKTGFGAMVAWITVNDVEVIKK